MKNSYLVSFDAKLEKKIVSYIKQHISEEIFVGLIGDLSGKSKSIIEFNICDAVPFPNIAKDKDSFAEVTHQWLDILREYLRFHYLNQKITRALGVLHSHPETIPTLSFLDQDFALRLTEELGNALMLIVGRDMTLFAYLVEAKQISRIKHTSKTFRKRYSI